MRLHTSLRPIQAALLGHAKRAPHVIRSTIVAKHSFDTEPEPDLVGKQFLSFRSLIKMLINAQVILVGTPAMDVWTHMAEEFRDGA